MVDIQKLFDAMSDNARRDRARYHLTLGQAIERLDGCDQAGAVVFSDGGHPGEADSYRGYYSDLALAPNGNLRTVAELVAELRRALNATFEGYKGGDFVMGPNTPLWRAPYGSTGEAIVDLVTQGTTVTLVTRDLEAL
jgi:hypothetical protein